MLKYILGAILLAAALSGGLVWYHHSGPYHFLTVTEGVLYRSGVLKPGELERVIEGHKIQTIVNLRTQVEMASGDWYALESGVCRKKGVGLVDLSLPVDDPPAQPAIDRWLDLLAEKDKLPILVHCKHGAVRTGMMVAIYEMEVLRKDNARVVEELPLFGHDFDEPVRQGTRDFLLKYVPRWKRSPEPPR